MSTAGVPFEGDEANEIFSPLLQVEEGAGGA